MNVFDGIMKGITRAACTTSGESDSGNLSRIMPNALSMIFCIARELR